MAVDIEKDQALAEIKKLQCKRNLQSVDEGFKEQFNMKVWEYIYERVRLGELDQLNENFEKCGLGIYASLFTGMTP